MDETTKTLIEFDSRDGVAIITFNQPEKLALSPLHKLGDASGIGQLLQP